MKKLIFFLSAGLFLLSAKTVWAVDTTPPSSSSTFNPALPDGDHGWYVSPVEVEVSATDLETGVASIFWRLGEGGWQEEIFDQTLNLAPNPSFETPSGWDFLGTEGSSGTWDDSTAYLDTFSVKISAPSAGWSSWNNADSYIVASPWSHMTAAVWVKTSEVSDFGVYFRVYALSPSGPIEIAVSDTQVTGTNDWTRLSSEFVVSVSDAYGLYLELGLNGTGEVWFDAVSVNEALSEISTSFVVSQNGDHTLEYYSLDRAGNEELPPKTSSLKIDTVAPGHWHDFESYRFGNEHTLVSEITVEDETSGLDQDETAFQYSVDGGSTWGYYWLFLTCWDWTWVEDGWLDTLEFPFWGEGGNEMRIMTPPIDYCNANWSECKIVRFKTRDLAGNESTKDICINGAWVRVEGGGDVYAQVGIEMQTVGSEENTEDLVYTQGDTLDNFTSEADWSIRSYSESNVSKPSYADLAGKFTSPVPASTLPTSDGYYLVDSDFTIANNTIPSGLDSAEMGAVVLINGDLTINEDYSLGPEGALVFVVAGDVRIDKKVTETAGFFLVDGNFDTAYNGGGNTDPWVLEGSMAADTITFARSLKGEGGNSSTPAEKIIFQPKYFRLLGEIFKTSRYTWEEVGPAGLFYF